MVTTLHSVQHYQPTMVKPSQILLLILTLKYSLSAKILLIKEKDELHLAELFKKADLEYVEHIVDHDQEDDLKQNTSFCEQLQVSGAISAVVDLSWGGWFAAQQISVENNIPYFRVEVSNAPFVQAADNFLSQRNALDAALIFQNEVELDQSLYFIIENYDLRILVMSLDDPERDVYDRLANVRPLPTAFVAFGTAENLSELVKKASAKKLIQRHSRWNFFVEDFASPDLKLVAANVDVVLASIRPEDCCGLLALSSSCHCAPGTKPKEMVAEKAGQIVAQALATVPNYSFRCSGSNVNNVQDVLAKVQQEAEAVKYELSGTRLHYPFQLDIKQVNSKSSSNLPIGQWTPQTKMVFQADFKNVTLPKLFRIGMTPSKPWMNFKLNSKNQRMKDENGEYIYEGYCIEFLEKLAATVGFEYEIVLSPDYQKSGFEYGRKNPDGSWSGLIGDLYAGKTDIIVADLTMTSEREEDIDYVSPYFDQAGMSIVQRKKYKEQSIFKFLYVLKPEVWMGILGAVIATALLIWFLDRFSPYSGRNNKEAYSGEVCRVFTLKESFWFALTSLTPQGGGEPPKALSGRVLAAAYWLFVVLMLATFTANLAAFLTVERMQTDLQGLEELAKQSRINYTVVRDTVYYDYFANMAGAEEMLYQKWKELSLNASEDAAKFRVWDYPIKEQWTQIYHAIQETGPVSSAAEGFKKVRDSLKGEFALIHDAAQIKYEVYNDCDLVEIGEPFSEQPYSLAVQQGSYLAEELSRTILQLQKERFFEVLQSKYWNTSTRHNCPVLDDTEGITLKSLGGVFIATLVGLVIAMVTLVFEVYMQRKKEKNEVQNVPDLDLPPKTVPNISQLFNATTSSTKDEMGGMPRVHL